MGDDTKAEVDVKMEEDKEQVAVDKPPEAAKPPGIVEVIDVDPDPPMVVADVAKSKPGPSTNSPPALPLVDEMVNSDEDSDPETPETRRRFSMDDPGHVADQVSQSPKEERQESNDTEANIEIASVGNPPAAIPEITIEDDEDEGAAGVNNGNAPSAASASNDVNGVRGMKRKLNGEEKEEQQKKKVFLVGEPFMQNKTCLKTSKFLTPCRDCSARDTDTDSSVVCRFQQFRKIIRKQCPAKNNAKDGFFVQFDGFCDPYLDPIQSDMDIWMPNPAKPPEELSLHVCKQLIAQLGDQVCCMVQEENNALLIDKSCINRNPNLSVAWKRIVPGVREMCDVCATTLFNYHWICVSCGFVACLACFKSRVEGVKKQKIRSAKKDEYNWIACSKNEIHVPTRMLLTQILPKNVLNEFNALIHRARYNWDIPQLCGCSLAKMYENVGNKAQKSLDHAKPDILVKPVNAELYNLLHAKDKKKTEKDEDSSSDESDDDSAALDALFAKMASKKKAQEAKQESTAKMQEEAQVANTTSEKSAKESDSPNGTAPAPTSAEDITNKQPNESQSPLKHYVRTQDKSYYERAQISALVSSLVNSSQRFPGVRHSWLCNGTLLKLDDPDHPSNIPLFQEVWRRGQPVIVSSVGQKLTKALWTPESFIKDYGAQTSDLINCLTGNVLQGQRVVDFWEGFIDVKKRMRDRKGKPMLLKLKDWPPTEDFAKFSPSRFEDLMQALPLGEYTHRDGKLNLAARLPAAFMRPDLGPKMYIAYGHGNNLDKGTTVLHMDISDAVNCMVYVGISKNSDPKHHEEVIKAVEESDCDFKMVERVTVKKELPGALWHIYRPWDADKIRDLLNKVALERGQCIEPNHDPIHDQVMYLDHKLRKRLREEYNVTGFPIVQCEGDLIFIPAGAPHQVRNLHNCIKIAEDFVSPENISHCFQLKEEFRNLSDTHSNHEDKLQIKNIVYHAVKDALSVLMNAKP